MITRSAYPFRHSGVCPTLQDALGHYNNIIIVAGNNNLDPSLAPNGFGQQLNMTPAELNGLTAFIKTLSGTKVYTDIS